MFYQRLGAQNIFLASMKKASSTQSELETDNPWHFGACNNIKVLYELINILVGTLKVCKGQQLHPPFMYVCM
jgi:hypothetical protein